MRKVVVNTTPLIALAGIGRLELLHQLYGEIMIPDAVLREIGSSCQSKAGESDKRSSAAYTELDR